MNRKTIAIALTALTLALILVPGVQAYPVENMVVVQDLPESMVAGNTYTMIITFDNIAKESVPLTIEISVTSVEIIGPGEIFVDKMWLNNIKIAENRDVCGFTIGGSVAASSHNELSITISTVINLMPGAYTFDIGLLGEEMVEPSQGPGITPKTYLFMSNSKPVADAGINQTVYVDETVLFDGSGSSDPDGTIMSWDWSFGDKEKASGKTTSHAYSESGNYTVTLTVMDNLDAEASDTCLIEVREMPPPPIIPPLPPVLSNLVITPTIVELGDEVTISFDIENIDSQQITHKVTMQVGELTLIIYVDLDAYEADTVTRTLTPEAEGTYDVTVDGLTGSFTVIVTPPPPPPPRPAEFIISGFTVSPTSVPTGTPVTVSITIMNIGEMAGNHTLDITVDGDTPEGPPIEVLLEGGASTTITITVIEEEPKEHTVKVDGLTKVFTVTAPAGFVWTPAYVSGVLILVLAGGGTVYLLYRRNLNSPPITE